MAKSKFHAFALAAVSICGLPASMNAQVNIHSIEHRGQTGNRNNIVVSGTTSSGTFTFNTLGSGGHSEIVILPEANSQVALLANKSIHAELEMVDSQLAEMKRIQSNHAKQVVELTLFDFGPDVSSQIMVFAKQFDQIENEHRSQLQAVLLPHQAHRMAEISLQISVNQKSKGSEVGNSIARALGMNDEDQKRFRKRAIEIEKDANKKIEQIKAEAREQLLDELTVEQRQELKQLTGDTFERFKTNPTTRQVQKFIGSDNKK